MTPEQKAAWLQSRCGKLSASRMADAMDYTAKGKPGARRIALMKELIAERMTGDSVNHYVDARMQRGLDLEPAGKAEYQVRTGRLLMPIGFVEHSDIPDFGATSDALVMTDAGLATWEMKAPDTVRHVDYMLAGNVVPEQYRPQVLAQCACNRVQHVVFASFDPRILNPAKRMHIVEWTPDAAEIEAVEQAARDFLRELESWWDVIHTETKEAA
jgi:hypothetical protein